MATKVIGGNTYRLKYTFRTKAQAQRVAKRVRSRGSESVRVLRSPDKGWDVWTIP